MSDGVPQTSRPEPVTIIGMGCRFPGGANSPEAFWRLLKDGVDAIAEVPADRFDIDAFYHPRPAPPGKTTTRWGGFLDQVDRFDAAFFGISPREAAHMDPQQRLMLEVAWEALEDAGQAPGSSPRSQAGVFIGMMSNDYEALMNGDTAGLGFYTLTGGGRYAASGRLSYALGLEGPSLTVDTACSSSLVAVHLACQSLRARECAVALAGGAHAILQPHIGICCAQAGMLAPDGRCKFGDVRADGFIVSEGVGMVVLKPLAAALADGDRIYAVITGSAVNNDGRSKAFGTPSRPVQEAVLRQAYRSAGISAGQIHYVEAHGTGTKVGDLVEVQALGAVLGEGRPNGRPCLLGSVKTNIGHTIGAAGVAGLIKLALCLTHRAIPPSLHFREPNPNIPWPDLPVAIQTAFGPWPTEERPARAGLNSFGLSGTNAHIVVEEAPEVPAARRRAGTGTGRSVHVLPLSARSPEALYAVAGAYRDHLAGDGTVRDASVEDICYTASARRGHHDHRLALVGHSREDLAEGLGAFLAGTARPGLSSGRTEAEGRRKVVFVFPGQGSQWFGMGRQLLEQEPAFREALERCDDAVQKHVGWSLLEELAADEARSRLHEIDVIQPTLFAIEVALAALWRSWGIEPDAVVGHSMGEVAAAHVAGALSLPDAARVICLRSRLLKGVSGRGTMAVVELSLEQARAALRGYEDRLSIAVSSSPRSTVISGDPGALEEVLAALQRQDIFCRRVKVDVASHSPQMDPLLDELVRVLNGLRPQAASRPIYSTVTGEIGDGGMFDAKYWALNLRRPVLFSPVVQRLLADGHDIFVEISPHPVLLSAIEDGLRHAAREGTVLPSLRREEEEGAVTLGSLGALYAAGYPVDWTRLHPSGGRCVPLPAYPWQRERFWLEGQGESHGHGAQRSRARRDGRAGHPLLGEHFTSSIHPDTHFWEMDLGPDAVSYLRDHRVREMMVLPGAAYVEMALAAAAEAFGPGPHHLEGVRFTEILVLPEEGARTGQLVLTPGGPGTAAFQFRGLQMREAAPGTAWTLHAAGTIRLDPAERTSPEPASPEDLQARCPEAVSGAEHYRAMAGRGIEHGPGFQGVKELQRADGEAIARLGLPETLRSGQNAYRIHPVLLDACFQVLGATAPQAGSGGDGGETFLPVGLDRLCVHGAARADADLWAHAVRRPEAGPDAGTTITGDVVLFDREGHRLLEVEGLRLQLLERRPEDLADWFYGIEWQLEARPEREGVAARPTPPNRQGRWLVFADGLGVGQTLASLLEAPGERCVLVSPGETYGVPAPDRYRLDPHSPEDFRRLLKETLGPDAPPCRGVVHLWSLEPPANGGATLASLEAAQPLGCVSVLHLVQALADAGWAEPPHLWLVTCGVQRVGGETGPVSIAQSPLWGLGAVIGNEHPELRCTRVDLSQEASPEEVHSLVEECFAGGDESQVAIRGGARYVARLVRWSPDGAPGGTGEQAGAGERAPAAADQPYRVEIATPGVLDRLALRATTRRAPGPGEVEIQVSASGLNFLDVMKAMGVCPGCDPGLPVALGAECAGKIVAVGEDVEEHRVGDEVVAIAFNSLGTHAVADARLVVPKPADLSPEEAATIPVAFATAHYALHHLARLRHGERVLIHAAAGGVGLAAAQLAQRVGAEIFATAGSAEKRQFLESLGVRHVMDSRSLSFAQEVMARTNGQGVDVVLNSLAGEAIAASLSVLAPYGRFLEIGKRDIYQNAQIGLWPFHKNLAYFAIDLDKMCRQRAAFVGSLLREVVQAFEEGTLAPLPRRVFPMSAAADAFRHMAQAKHIGKIVLTPQGQAVLVAPAADGPTFRSDATYLITGGLGGLGLQVAQWMVREGARHLVLVGRRGAAGTAAQEAVVALEKAGAEVLVARADVSQEPQVAGLLRSIEQTMPPLRGVIHAAGVLDDGILLHLNAERFRSVMAPKMAGAWNLHALTSHMPLDFFVVFSSVASLLGTAGQGNYAAANAFLDALARHRVAEGRPAMGINWGAWAEIGLAAAQANRGAQLASRGLGSIRPERGLSALAHLLRHAPAQVAVTPLDVEQWCRSVPAAARSGLFARLDGRRRPAPAPASGASAGEGNVRDALLALESASGRRALLEDHIREQIARVLKLEAARIDSHKPLRTMGLDSLMTLELRNRLEASLGLTLSATLAWNYPTISALAPYLAERMRIPLEPAEPTRSQAATCPTGQNGDQELAADPRAAAQPSEDGEAETEAALAAELRRVDELLRRRRRP